MIIYNAKLGGTLKSIIIKDGIIQSICENRTDGDLDAKGLNAIPGLIDVHTHGCGGRDTMDADFEPLCKSYALGGTTAFLPTTMTMDAASLHRVTEAHTDFYGAQVLGFHLEGPYISKKYKGAQNEAYIRNADYEEFRTFKNVKMITVAPETPDAFDFISKASADGCVVSLGHTAATYDEASKAFACGASCVSHLYNAMPPFHHRETGVIGAAFMHRPYAQIICDGLHVSRAAFMTAYKMLGSDRLTLISDSIRPAGLPDGEYESGGLKVILKNREARLEDGTLAGSSSMLMDCVKKAIEFGVPRSDAIKMASETPARMLGVKKGVIAEGYDADILLTDDELNISSVIIGGKIID